MTAGKIFGLDYGKDEPDTPMIIGVRWMIRIAFIIVFMFVFTNSFGL